MDSAVSASAGLQVTPGSPNPGSWAKGGGFYLWVLAWGLARLLPPRRVDGGPLPAPGRGRP